MKETSSLSWLWRWETGDGISLSWLWRWETGDGITHYSTDIDEADRALHTSGTVMVLAERMKK